MSLSILVAVIFFTNSLTVKRKEVNTQPRPAITQGVHKSENSCLQSFEAADRERTAEHALGPFIEQILLQKAPYNIFGSTATYATENIHEINKTGIPGRSGAIKTPDIIIMLMVVFMMFFFTI